MIVWHQLRVMGRASPRCSKIGLLLMSRDPQGTYGVHPLEGRFPMESPPDGAVLKPGSPIAVEITVAGALAPLPVCILWDPYKIKVVRLSARIPPDNRKVPACDSLSGPSPLQPSLPSEIPPTPQPAPRPFKRGFLWGCECDPGVKWLPGRLSVVGRPQPQPGDANFVTAGSRFLGLSRIIQTTDRPEVISIDVSTAAQ